MRRKKVANLFAKLTKVTERFLDVALQYVGAVPYDEAVRKAVQKQRAVYEAYPRSKCALAFKAIAQKIDTGRCPQRRAAISNSSWSASSVPLLKVTNDGCRIRYVLQQGSGKGCAVPPDRSSTPRWSSESLTTCWRLPASVQVDDLIQAGMIGLLEAAKKYDAGKGAGFETYAGIRIRGTMLDEVRKGTGRRARCTATRAWSARRSVPSGENRA